MDVNQLPQLVNVVEIMKALRISKSTYKRWMKKDHPLKKILFKVGGRWYTTLEDLMIFIEFQKKGL